MDTVIYWLQVFGYFVLGIVTGLIFVGLLYPVLRTAPMTIALVIQKRLRLSALVNIGYAITFALVLLIGGYLLIGLLTPAWNVVTSRSFLVGLIFTFGMFVVQGGFGRGALQADYADFVTKHRRIPEGVTTEELEFAGSVIDWWISEDPKELSDMKSKSMYQLADSFDFHIDHEQGIIKAFEFIRADPSCIETGIYRSAREYFFKMKELDRGGGVDDDVNDEEFDDEIEDEYEELKRLKLELRETQEKLANHREKFFETINELAGDKNAAKEILAEMYQEAELEPGSKEYFAQQALIHWKQGKRERALLFYNKALPTNRTEICSDDDAITVMNRGNL